MQDELETIRKAQQGSREAFCELVRAHYAGICAHLSRFVKDPVMADDLAQEVFLKAYNHLGTYREESAFRTWLFSIARREAQMFLRQEARRRDLQRRSVANVLEGWLHRRFEEQAGDPESDERWLAALRGCLENLPEHSGMLVRDFYFNGLNAGEIARRTGKKENAAWVSLMRVRQALRECVRRKHRIGEAPA